MDDRRGTCAERQPIEDSSQIFTSVPLGNRQRQATSQPVSKTCNVFKTIGEFPKRKRMKKIHALITMFLLLSIFLLACGIPAPQPTPTSTGKPTETPWPTSTPLPIPTSTPVLTNTPVIEPTISEQTNSIGACIISTDDTYGYTQENPIKVGGDAFDGPPRERAFLDNLLGPNGETISYERTGSLAFGNTILDAFEITGLNKEVILYIDEYAFTEPHAPVGFTCLSAFPLTAP